VSSRHPPYRKSLYRQSLYRKPSKLTISVAGATVVTSLVVTAGISGMPGALGQVAPRQSMARIASMDAGFSLASYKWDDRALKLATMSQDLGFTAVTASQEKMNIVAAQRALAERAAARRAARRAAARRAAARRAAAREAARRAAAREAASAATTPAQPSGSPQQIAASMLGSYGWSGQFSCLDTLWARESGWNPYAMNPTTGAYGIPQALPGSKMATAGADWQSNAATQIRWGLGYIQQDYGSPCTALSHQEATGWY
jgi:hypothetical protein